MLCSLLNRGLFKPTLSLNTRIFSLAFTALLVISTNVGIYANADQIPELRARLNASQNVYHIAPGDSLSINVYNQADLSGTGIIVRPDGYASFNGIGEVSVSGKTVQEVTNLLERRLKDLVREPIVSITVTDSRAPVIALAGAVMHPGVLQPGLFPISGSATSNDSSSSNSGASSMSGSPAMGRMDYRLSSILASSGGVQLSADLSNVQIMREGQPTLTTDLWKLIRNGDMTQDVMLQNGDTVYVPILADAILDDASYQMLLRSGIGPRTFPVRVIGYAAHPGVYDLNGTSPYLDTAIAKAGGFNVGANRKKIALRRFSSETKFSTMAIDPNKTDFMLRPNDVIYVAELTSSKSGHFMENVSKVLSPFTNVTATILNYAILNRAYNGTSTKN